MFKASLSERFSASEGILFELFFFFFFLGVGVYRSFLRIFLKISIFLGFANFW